MTRADEQHSFEGQTDPDLTLRDTSGQLVWRDLYRSYWDKFKIEPADRTSFYGSDTSRTSDNKKASSTAVKDEDFQGVAEPPKRFAVYEPPAVSFYPLQEWEGYVIRVDKKTFSARLIDITEGDQFYGEEVDLSIDDLADDDLSFLAPGRVFRWAIGYERSRAGSKKRVSQIIFRRLPKWTETEIIEAKEEGRQLTRHIKE